MRRISNKIRYTILEDDAPAVLCESEGYLRDPEDCGVFYYCMESGAPAIVQTCGPGLYFDEKSYACDWPTRVECP